MNVLSGVREEYRWQGIGRCALCTSEDPSCGYFCLKLIRWQAERLLN
jgi:hypothetical protein